MLTEIDYRKLVWHSRRGMLELDLLLRPFVEQHLQKQPMEVQLLYRDLLTEEDQDLFAWLVQREPSPTPSLARIVTVIQDCVIPTLR